MAPNTNTFVCVLLEMNTLSVRELHLVVDLEGQ